MLTLQSFNVITYNPNGPILNWDYAPTVENLNNYDISIYRSEAPSTNINDYVLIASGISGNSNSYIDVSLYNLMQYGRNWYYKLEIHDNVSNSFSIQPEIPAYTNITRQDKIVSEIIRRKSISMNTFVGRTFKLRKRRTWGEHCTRCWDSILMRTTDPNCPICYGTGWVNGYYNPIIFLGMINAAPQYNQIQMFGEWKPSDIMLYTLHFPLLTTRDIVQDDNGRLWLVNQIRLIQKFGITIEQIVQLSLISFDDNLYKLLNK